MPSRARPVKKSVVSRLAGKISRARFRTADAEIRRRVRDLQLARKPNRKDVLLGSGVLSTTFALASSVAESLSHNTSFALGVTMIGSATALGVAAGPAVERVASNPGIRKATQLVGSSLSSLAKKNAELRAFLNAHRYVYVNGKGQIVGTNMPRLIPGVGRIRLESKKILARDY